jgi:XTP/dITP diphosphohydrolase
MTCKLLIATNNQGKAREFHELLDRIPFELVTLADLGITTQVEETGKTFEENARIKACAYAAASGLVTLADDSGLEVEALGGEPGIRSARYAGENASDSDRVNLLLSKLKSIPLDKRNARFKCVIAISTPTGEIAVTEGECQGLIEFEPKGKNGFGYDPVFFFPDLGKTMAELPSEVKGQISHRARAARQVPDILSRPPFFCQD